jgi:formate hydrogenlyase subunit 3/multisubunit Na+/H+ antiporter MnhD subunit
LSKDNLKARLAYSTVSQLSYIILGVALLKPAGIEGGLVHIANHAFSKITLFFCAGAIYVATHKKNISEMSGLGRVMPWTFGAFALASLSMIGAPLHRNHRRAAGEHAAQRGLFRPGGVPGLLRQNVAGGSGSPLP